MIADLLAALLASPWLYLALFTVAAVDGVFLVVPSETSLVAAGVLAAAGTPDLTGIVAASAGGAVIGDTISYLAGRRAGPRTRVRLSRSRRGQRAVAWAEHALARRGVLLIVVARYVPGGRTATTFTAGAVAYPPGRFLLLASVAALTWASYSTLIGYWGGRTFEDSTLKGLLAALGVVFAVTGLVEAGRWLTRRVTPPRAHDESQTLTVTSGIASTGQNR